MTPQAEDILKLCTDARKLADSTPQCDDFSILPMPYIPNKAPSQICAIGWEQKAKEIESESNATIARMAEALEEYVKWAQLAEIELGHIEKTHRCNDHHCEVCHALQSIPEIPNTRAHSILTGGEGKV